MNIEKIPLSYRGKYIQGYRCGRGTDAILLLHGSGVDNALLSWKEVMERLGKRTVVYAVDLPGYGYAKANEEVKAKWVKMIEDYLHKSKQRKIVFLLIDIRHEPSGNDKIMYNWIVNQGFKPVIIATKLDKINRSQIQKQVKLIKTTLQTLPETIVIPFSSDTTSVFWIPKSSSSC